jgi:hypothetical protein
MKCYITEEIKWDAMFITLNKLFFNKEIEKPTIIMLSSCKEVEAKVFRDILFINITSEISEAEQLGYLLFEMCQMKAFSLDTEDRDLITHMLADELDKCGFYVEDKNIIIEERFIEESSEYKDIQEEFIFTLNDIKKSILTL